MSIKIVADRMIDLSDAELNEMGISTIGCYVNMGDKSYVDLEDVTPEDVAEYVAKTGKMAKTAAQGPEIYAEFFKPFVDAGQDVIHFACSSGISSICNNSIKAAEGFNGKVVVIDTLALSGGIALLVKYAINLIANGEKNIVKIAELCRAQIKNIQCSFLLDTLEFLYKGGRCSGFTYFGANLLRIKPVIYMGATGAMKVREKHRGRFEKVLPEYIKTTFAKYPNPNLDMLRVSYYSFDASVLEFIKAEIAKYHTFKEIIFNKVGCNCFIHSGKNTVGIFYRQND